MSELLYIQRADIEVVARVSGQSLPEQLTGVWHVPIIAEGESILRVSQLVTGKNDSRIVTVQGKNLAIAFFEAIRGGREFSAKINNVRFTFRASDVSLVLRFFGEFIGDERCVEGTMALMTRDGLPVAEFEVFESQVTGTDRNLKWEVNDVAIAHSVLKQLEGIGRMSIELCQAPRG